jgi:signal peptidase I
MVFTPGGTGSNVVLGLLVACAGVYLVTVNLGPALDDALFAGADRKRQELLRYTEELTDEVEAALARATKGKKPKVDADARARLAASLQELSAARDAAYGPFVDAADKPKKVAALDAAKGAMEAALRTVFPDDDKAGFFAQARSLGFAFAVALALRAFAVEPFQIPSGSMIPTLLVGDHLFVARAMYGLQVPFAKEPKYFLRWALPQPGDVVVFTAPPYVGDNAGEDWIKRVIAGPGQRVKMVDTVLHVDGKPYAHIGPNGSRGEVTRYLDYDERGGEWLGAVARKIVEDVAGRPHDVFLSEPTRENWPTPTEPFRSRVQNIGPAQGLTCSDEDCVVNPGHIFVMGDNRDHSSDGRRWGAVPVDNVKGRAMFIWMSVDGSERSVDLGRFTLPRFRWERLFQSIR